MFWFQLNCPPWVSAMRFLLNITVLLYFVSKEFSRAFNSFLYTVTKAAVTVEVWYMDGFCSRDEYILPHVSPQELRSVKWDFESQ